mmetsp:Transcript_27410/g.59551  ORF Transcript_27410/g.59551 Transcript_27410/m.59551 type:complete len:229 (+) Transcript_27410:379-1065(+)
MDSSIDSCQGFLILLLVLQHSRQVVVSTQGRLMIGAKGAQAPLHSSPEVFLSLVVPGAVLEHDCEVVDDRQCHGVAGSYSGLAARQSLTKKSFCGSFPARGQEMSAQEVHSLKRVRMRSTQGGLLALKNLPKKGFGFCCLVLHQVEFGQTGHDVQSLGMRPRKSDLAVAKGPNEQPFGLAKETFGLLKAGQGDNSVYDALVVLTQLLLGPTEGLASSLVRFPRLPQVT